MGFMFERIKNPKNNARQNREEDTIQRYLKPPADFKIGVGVIINPDQQNIKK